MGLTTGRVLEKNAIKSVVCKIPDNLYWGFGDHVIMFIERETR